MSLINSKNSISNKSEKKWNIGDLLINRRGEIKKITKKTKEGFNISYENSEGEWSHYSTLSLDRLDNEYVKLEKSLEEYQLDLVKAITEESPEIEMSESTDLMTRDENQLLTLKEGIERKRNDMMILERLLELKKYQMNDMISKLNDQVESIMRVVGIIETYLGVGEEIVQIREGDKALSDCPVYFRQLVLHMDEEVAILTDEGKGIDFTQIELFDKWVTKNIDKILPEKKGVLVCRPRRLEKKYTGNPLVDAALNEQNFTTYIIIRNGDNIYRIKSMMHIYPLFFPPMDFFKEKESTGWLSSFDKEEKEEEILRYKRNALLMQGLLDRTDILHPIPKGVSIMDPDTWGEAIRFIYDGSDQLPDGRLSYFDWLKSLNVQIKRGSRIYFTGFDYQEEKSYRMAESGWGSNWRENHIPYDKRPKAGVYNIDRVEKTKEEKDRFVFLSNPGGTVFNLDFSSHDRKRSCTYYVYPNDTIIIHYDKISLEDIKYYMEDRVNRTHYLSMLPVLRGIYEKLLEEKKWENEFKKLVSHRTGKSEAQIDEAIEWWKYKVINKRPLKKEDAKALRMIEGFLKKLK